jgi:RimJ/RimL family protein N-acetyltransferase
MLSVFVARDEQIELRPMLEMSAKDWSFFYKYFRDREIASLNGATPIFMPLWLFKRVVMGEEKSGERIGFGIYAERVFVGSIEFYDLEPSSDSAVVGILIGEKNLWGTGVGTKAMKLALSIGFMQKNFSRVHLQTLEDNWRARKSFEKVGFRFVGIRDAGRKRYAIYEILKQRWLETTA